jgi:hypothetical protein
MKSLRREWHGAKGYKPDKCRKGKNPNKGRRGKNRTRVLSEQITSGASKIARMRRKKVLAIIGKMRDLAKTLKKGLLG